jgi:hypothetical protein
MLDAAEVGLADVLNTSHLSRVSLVQTIVISTGLMQAQRLSTAEILEKIVKQAAEEDGAFYIPISKERSQALRAVSHHVDRLLLDSLMTSERCRDSGRLTHGGACGGGGAAGGAQEPRALR